jgi:hypothetical protein
VYVAAGTIDQIGVDEMRHSSDFIVDYTGDVTRLYDECGVLRGAAFKGQGQPNVIRGRVILLEAAAEMMEDTAQEFEIFQIASSTLSEPLEGVFGTPDS